MAGQKSLNMAFRNILIEKKIRKAIYVDRVKELVHCPRLEPAGRGIGVAVLDTGISPHPDFLTYKECVRVFEDFVNFRERAYDDCGHGTHVEGILCGSGLKSGGRFAGIAPKADLIALKVLDSKGNGNTGDVLRALDWIYENRRKYNIRVINISVGTVPQTEAGESFALLEGVEEAWDRGFVVVAAAGNNGPKPQSITVPGISRKVITVGCSDDQFYVDHRGRKRMNYSGRGPTASCVVKPDILAPGSQIVSCNSRFRKKGERYYAAKSGTSMATPVVSGAIALLLSKHPDMSNVEVKLKLGKSAVDLGLPSNQQGFGMLHVGNLLKV